MHSSRKVDLCIVHFNFFEHPFYGDVRAGNGLVKRELVSKQLLTLKRDLRDVALDVYTIFVNSILLTV